eukprot:3935787-Rhodomonas_salina.3
MKATLTFMAAQLLKHWQYPSHVRSAPLSTDAPGMRCPVLTRRMALAISCAPCGTNIAYDATASCYAHGTEVAYDATRAAKRLPDFSSSLRPPAVHLRYLPMHAIRDVRY